MASHILEIAENNRYLSIQHKNICIKKQNTVLGTVALDMIACVLLTAQGITLSKQFLACMGEENIPVLVMGSNYLPVSMALPVSSHYRHLAVAEEQIKAGPIIKKQIWQQIVAAKIKNQAQALEKCILPSNDGAKKDIETLKSLAQRVRSGDSDNKEAQAARIYWQALFGKNFLRNTEEEGINSFLNYGYAVLRAVCARALCASGFLPMFGVHHRNQFNAFCLADDIMEPFRPFVDCLVHECIQNSENAQPNLTAQNKRRISAILQSPLYMGEEESTLMPVVLKTAQALYKSYGAKRALLSFPELKKK